MNERMMQTDDTDVNFLQSIDISHFLSEIRKSERIAASTFVGHKFKYSYSILTLKVQLVSFKTEFLLH